MVVSEQSHHRSGSEDRVVRSWERRVCRWRETTASQAGRGNGACIACTGVGWGEVGRARAFDWAVKKNEELRERVDGVQRAVCERNGR